MDGGNTIDLKQEGTTKLNCKGDRGPVERLRY